MKLTLLKEPSPAVRGRGKRIQYLGIHKKKLLPQFRKNLSKLGDFLVDPLGVNVEKDLTDVDEQAAEQEVGVGTIHNMKKLFDGDLGAFSLSRYGSSYIPCCASIGAMS